MKTLTIALLAVAAASAQTVVFSDNFTSYAPASGLTALGTNWTATTGSVNLVAHCVNDSPCVEFGPSRIESRELYLSPAYTYRLDVTMSEPLAVWSPTGGSPVFIGVTDGFRSLVAQSFKPTSTGLTQTVYFSVSQSTIARIFVQAAAAVLSNVSLSSEYTPTCAVTGCWF